MGGGIPVKDLNQYHLATIMLNEIRGRKIRYERNKI